MAYAQNYLEELNSTDDIELEDRENFYDVMREVTAQVRNALQEERSGAESREEANRLARQIVDDELG